MVLKRVVVTGLSAVSPLGSSISSTCEGILAKRSGLRRLQVSDFPYSNKCSLKILGFLDSWDQKHWSSKNTVIKAVVNSLSLCTSTNALEDAKWKPETTEHQNRTGVIFGTSRVSTIDISKYCEDLYDKNIDRMDRLLKLKSFPPIIPGAISIFNKLSGYSLAEISGNTAGLNTVIGAYKVIALGDADVIISGSVENPFEIALLQSLSYSSLGSHVNNIEDLTRLQGHLTLIGKAGCPQLDLLV